MPRPPEPEVPSPAACLNCSQPLDPPRPKYCPACGQETNLKPPTVGEFVQQFGGAYFATEGALWRTLKLLLFRPGELTRLYLRGRRKHYVLPLRLYLTISVIVLLGMRMTTAVDVQISPERIDTGQARNLTLQLGGSARAGLKDGVFYCNGLPQWVCKRVQRRIDLDPKAMAREMEQMQDRFMGNIGGAMFLLLPGFALWLKLAYLNRRLRYTEHLVFALHVHAFWFLMLALAFADLPFVSVLAVAAVPVYTLLAMRRVYGGRWWPLLLRAGVVSALYGVTLGVALAGVALVTLLF